MHSFDINKISSRKHDSDGQFGEEAFVLLDEKAHSAEFRVAIFRNFSGGIHCEGAAVHPGDLFQ